MVRLLNAAHTQNLASKVILCGFRVLSRDLGVDLELQTLCSVDVEYSKGLWHIQEIGIDRWLDVKRKGGPLKGWFTWFMYIYIYILLFKSRKKE